MWTGLSANRASNDSGKTGTMNMIRERYLVDYYKMSSSCMDLFFSWWSHFFSFRERKKWQRLSSLRSGDILLI